MAEFEFLSVLISMIFGLGLTHVLAGTMRYVYAGRATEQRLVYSPLRAGRALRQIQRRAPLCQLEVPDFAGDLGDGRAAVPDLT